MKYIFTFNILKDESFIYLKINEEKPTKNNCWVDTNTGKGKDKTEKLPRQKKSFFVHQFATDTKHRTVMYVITLNTEL